MPLAVKQKFSQIGLPICDDEQLIKSEIAKQRDRRLREQNSPTPSVQIAARQWFADTSELVHQRPQILKVVKDAAYSRCAMALPGIVSSGATKLTADQRTGFKDIYVKEYGVRQDLAQQWLDEFLRDKKIDSVIPQPELVRNFRAKPTGKSIALSWDLPPAGLERLEIFREEEDANGKTHPPQLVFNGASGTSLIDAGIKPGTAYYYRAYSVKLGARNAQPASCYGYCLGSVRDLKAEWNASRKSLSLTWHYPPGCTRVHLFASQPGRPTIRWINGAPIFDANVLHLHETLGAGFELRQPSPGATYHFAVVVEFENGETVPAEHLQFKIPQPPPPPTNLTVAYFESAGAHTVALKWSPPPGSHEFVVLRRDGPLAPGNPGEGKQLAERLPSAEFLDSSVQPGKTYSYAVFAVDSGLMSTIGAKSRAVVIAADVVDLSASTGNGTAALAWKVPCSGVEIIVRRALAPVADASTGVAVPNNGMTANDAGLTNGVTYHYAVFCRYTVGPSQSLFSAGRRITVQPSNPLRPVVDLKVHSAGGAIRIEWSNQNYQGKVVVYRSATATSFTPGALFNQRVFTDHIAKAGAVPVTNHVSPTEIVDLAPAIDQPFYSAWTVSPTASMFGGERLCAFVPDVSALEAANTPDGVILRWQWPDRCSSVRVCHRLGSYPESLTAGTGVEVTLDQYRKQGGKHLIPFPADFRGHLHIIVFACTERGTTSFLSGGSTPGCRVALQREPWRHIEYLLRRDSRHKLSLDWELHGPVTGFRGVRLLAAPDFKSLDGSGAVELYRSAPGTPRASATIDVRPQLSEGWVSLYYRLVCTDSHEETSSIVVHPGRYISLLKKEAPDPLTRTGATYLRKRTKTFVCPFCMVEYPLAAVRWGNAERSSPQVGIVTHRVFGNQWHLEPPSTRSPFGRALGTLSPFRSAPSYDSSRLVKYCPEPKCDKRLPSTIGQQDNILIGIIGAVESGKTHFIASLIHQLGVKVSRSFRASLLPLNDDTTNNYTANYYTPLIDKHLMLPKTSGLPPPLIYELTFNADLFPDGRNRSVTLVFYDTAGEKLQKQQDVDIILRYVKYLSGLIVLMNPLPGASVINALHADSVISNVMSVLEEGKLVSNQHEKIDIPVAIALSKCDTLVDGGKVPQNCLWSTSVEHRLAFNHRLHTDNARRMAEFLDRWYPNVMGTVDNRFRNYSFFGTSATGCSPDPRDRKFPYIKPLRVEEPLLWLLASLGVIPMNTTKLPIGTFNSATSPQP